MCRQIYFCAICDWGLRSANQHNKRSPGCIAHHTTPVKSAAQKILANMPKIQLDGMIRFDDPQLTAHIEGRPMTTKEIIKALKNLQGKARLVCEWEEDYSGHAKPARLVYMPGSWQFCVERLETDLLGGDKWTNSGKPLFSLGKAPDYSGQAIIALAADILLEPRAPEIECNVKNCTEMGTDRGLCDHHQQVISKEDQDAQH